MASNKGGSVLAKIAALVGLGAVVFIGVTWILPKLERHAHPMVHGAVLPPHLHPTAATSTTVATGPAAVHQSTGGTRDYNLAGLAIGTDDDGRSISMAGI